MIASLPASWKFTGPGRPIWWKSGGMKSWQGSEWGESGAAFFGESMFLSESGASRVAPVALVEILKAGGQPPDIQWVTPHRRQFGAVEVFRDKYLEVNGT